MGITYEFDRMMFEVPNDKYLLFGKLETDSKNLDSFMINHRIDSDKVIQVIYYNDPGNIVRRVEILINLKNINWVPKYVHWYMSNKKQIDIIKNNDIEIEYIRATEFYSDHTEKYLVGDKRIIENFYSTIKLPKSELGIVRRKRCDAKYVDDWEKSLHGDYCFQIIKI